MMFTLALMAMSPDAHAAREADLGTTLTLPASSLVYADDTYQVTVANKGNKNASGVELVIQLPETNTSPTVHVMGLVTDLDASCSESGTQITCSLGRIRKNRSETITFDMQLPQSAGSLDFDATASTSTSEANPADDSDSGAASVSYVDVVIAGTVDALNQHCTGQNLEAFWECVVSPGSITDHEHTFNADGSITFTDQPDYGGSWDQDSDDHLWFVYTLDGDVVAEFEGNGVNADCFEGLTTFPGSAWVAPYEVCLLP